MTAIVAKKAVDLGLLEEDDEFEEFPTKGEWYLQERKKYKCFVIALPIYSSNRPFANFLCCVPLENFRTDLKSQLKPFKHVYLLFSEQNVKENEDDVNVWEDNWDDDAIEDDFSVQLR